MGTIIEIEPMRELLYADWDALDALCSGLDEHQWATPTCLPGWTVKDVLAHIAGIAHELLPHAERADDQAAAAGVGERRPHGFGLHDGLAEAE